MTDAGLKSSIEKADGLYFLAAPGEMAEMIRATNWSETSLGDPLHWPQCLKTMTSVMLHNPIGMSILWGEDFIQLYNDAYRPILGTTKHPSSLGKSCKENFAEAWTDVGPLLEKARSGEAVRISDFKATLNRNGFDEDCYFDFSYSPIFEENNEIGGVLITVVETTNRKKTEDTLKESEARFRTMAEGTHIYIAVGDESSNAVYFNKAWSELTGRPMEDLLAYGWADLIHPEDKEKYLTTYQEAFKKKEPFSGEFRILSKNGDYRWLLAAGPPRFRQDGSFAGYISSCVDITERKLMEKRLLENEHLLLSIINSAPFPIGVYVGPEMRITLANQNIMDTWDKGNDIVGKTYMEVLPELANTGIYEQLQQVLETGIPFHATNQRVDLVVDNILQPFYFNYSFTPLFDTSGKIFGVMNTAANVTEIAMANLKVKESEKSLRQTILQAPVAMCILKGPTHVVDLANERMFELWGKPSEVILNKPIFEGLPEAKNQGFEALLDGVYATGKAFVAEGVSINLPRKDGIETVYINFVYEAYRESEGTISGILVVAVEVTAQVLARQKIEEVVEERTKELADANISLQKSNAELAQFAYIASHDLQEPVRKISNFTQLLQKRIGHVIDDQAQSYLLKINNSAARMHTLIRDVLTYSELVKEKEVFEEVDLGAVLQSTLTDFELLIDQKKATITYDVLPTIEAIPLQMSQLFGNIIGNALKFSRKEVDPIITITASPLTKEEQLEARLEPALDYIRIQFKDNGIGFNEEHAEKIFNIFQRLHRKSEYEGTGIGLAMCKKIALNHRGDLNAQGSSEQGAVFNAILPLKQAGR